MLDLSRCRNLVEFEFGEALEECLGSVLEPVERPTRTPIVGTISEWHSWLCIRPPLEWCSPSFMLASVAQHDLQAQGWKDAPLCGNVVAVQIVLDDAEGHAHEEALPRDWISLNFTARDVRTDARNCAQRVCDRFFERQTRVLHDTFTLYLEWRVSCLKHPCAPRPAQNRQPRRPSASCLRIWDEDTPRAIRRRSKDGHGAIPR